MCGSRIAERSCRWRWHHVGVHAHEHGRAGQSDNGGEKQTRLGAVDEPPEKRVGESERERHLKGGRPSHFALEQY